MTIIDTARTGHRSATTSRWLSLIILCIGFLMIVVDATIVNVALPSIRRDLGFSQADLAWVVNAYLIAYGGFLLLAGRLGDLMGRKRIFLTGLAMFTAASVLCGLSFSQPMLIAARFLQGLGGAVGTAVILGMVVTMFPEPAERARAMGIFAFIASAGASIGLIAGGLITQSVSWHWIFIVNLPIGLITAIVAWRLLESEPGLGLSEGADVLGAFLVTTALVLGVYAIVQSERYGWVSVQTLGIGLVATTLLAAFIWRQATTRNPLVPLRLFRSRNLSAANVIQASMLAGMFGFFFLGTLDLQRVLHYGPLAIGLAFLPNAVAMGVLSVGLSARMIMRFGARSVLLAGQMLVAISLILLVLGPETTDYLRDWLVPMVLLGIGAGLAFPALTILAMADATPSDSGLASGILNTTTQVGAALGLAVLATLSTNRTSQLLGDGESATSALSSGYHFAWAIGAGLVLVSIVLAATVLRPSTAVEPDDSIELEEESA
ncbi:MAG: MFS transporter [Chloroflexi bacterium]|nr:MAG: MFS transporter [Chloroflexota bacterium]